MRILLVGRVLPILLLWTSVSCWDGTVQKIINHNGLFGRRRIGSACDPASSRPIVPNFEPAEHRSLGDALTLQFDHGIRRPGHKLEYPIGSDFKLSFGTIVSLADFYSHGSINNGLTTPCSTQISDPGLDESAREEKFKSLVDWLHSAAEYPNNLTCIISVLGVQSMDMDTAADPAQCFNERNSGFWGYDAQFSRCIGLHYLNAARCNWDHFGNDAVVAYNAGHRAALLLAKLAINDLDLKKAYAYEAFAQHFLSDLFSAGHLRPPRRVLHTDSFFRRYPADRLSKYMHDEDSANGLWVTNALGESWPMYGDKQLFPEKSGINRDQAIQAMQSSVDEIYSTFKTRKIPKTNDFIALKKIPLIPSTRDYKSFQPMFSVSSDAKILCQRSELNDRGNRSILALRVDKLNSNGAGWSKLASSVNAAEIITHMYPRTIPGFHAEANISQIQQLNSSHLVINQYGPIWINHHHFSASQPLQRSWNMKSKVLIPVDVDLNGFQWEYISRTSPKSFLLIGSRCSAKVHLGISNDEGLSSGLLWTRTYRNQLLCKESSYQEGLFSSGSRAFAIIKHCKSSNPHNELWVLHDRTAAPVLLQVWPAELEDEIHNFALQIHNQQQIFVEVKYHKANQSNTWSLTEWRNNYLERHKTVLIENHVMPAYKFLPDRSESSIRRVIRVHHSKELLAFSIDTLEISPDQGTMKRVQGELHNYDLLSCSTIYWLLLDVNNDGRSDAVCFCPEETKLRLVVLVMKDDGSFAPPISSELPGDFVSDFHGDYSKHIHIMPTRRFNSSTGIAEASIDSILQLFDNYGVLGARLLSPTDNDHSLFTASGQYPAVAGQTSHALGGNGIGWLSDGDLKLEASD